MKLHPHWRRALLLVALVSALSACRKSAPIDGPTPNANKGKLTVLLPPVEHRVLELAEGQTLGKGDSVDILPGNMVVTGEGGHADLTWPEFMALDLATGTDLLVSVAQPSRSQASFDQAAGTVRYRLVGDDTAALFTVQAAAWAVIEVAKAPADIIVSLMPGPEPAVWVAVVKGSADLRRGAEKLRLKGGQVAAITEQGALPPLMEVDREALSDWYDDYAGGKDPGAQPADFLFRCAVRGEGAQLRPAPGGIPVDGAMTLDVGAVVQVAGRSADGAWVFVRAEEGEAGGWLEATDLNCNGPVANLAVDDGAPEVTATLPAASTPTRLAAVTGSPTPRRTPTAATATVTASPTLTAAVISLSADKTDLTAGECTTLRWTVKGVRSYSLNGVGKAGDEGSEKVCPQQNTTYKLTAILLDGSESSQDLRIKVRAALSTAAPTASAGPPTTVAATATAKPTAGPTVPPTAISLPTESPAPTDKPTDVPTPEPPPSATP